MLYLQLLSQDRAGLGVNISYFSAVGPLDIFGEHLGRVVHLNHCFMGKLLSSVSDITSLTE